MMSIYINAAPLAIVALSPLPASAGQAVSTTTAPDPARHAAARRVVEQFLPPQQRDRMIEAMMAGMHGNIRQSMLDSPEMASLFAKEPKAKAMMTRFLEGEQKRSSVLIRQSMPMLIDAMTKAYARRFTVAQLGEIEAFFVTPTGKLYVSESMTFMSDPDVQAAQRTMMMRSMEGMQERIAKLTGEIAASADKAPADKDGE